ncbi:hypothetical protein [Actinomadura rubrobrunea]|uniref:hypothetical protein n=1 Tax=Actinomadura rubrobrunea TaxID=115335 RepID=UPI0036F26F56
MIQNKAVSSTTVALKLRASLSNRVAIPRHRLSRLTQRSTTPVSLEDGPVEPWRAPGATAAAARCRLLIGPFGDRRDDIAAPRHVRSKL